MRFEDMVDVLEPGLESLRFRESARDSEGNATGGKRCGRDIRLLSLDVDPASSGRSSSVEMDTRGGEEMIGSGSGGGDSDRLSRILGATDIREPWVLTLNRERDGGFQETMLSRLFAGTPDARIILCLRVRSSTFFSVLGKYSAKCVVMSSLGGRCPEKLRNLPLLFGLVVGLSWTFGEIVEVDGASGICTPSPLRILMELARLYALVPGIGAVWPSGVRSVSLDASVLVDARGNAVRWGLVGLVLRLLSWRSVKPYSRAGSSGEALQIEINCDSVRGERWDPS